MSKDSQRLKIFKIAQECKGSPTRISHALIDAGFRDITDLKKWLEEEIKEWKESKMRGFKMQNFRLESESHKMISIYQEILDKLESL
jgi:hypothetical protein